MLLEKIELITHDLKNVLPFYGKYDMAISLEVAEHLPENRGKSFISDLCELSSVVLFSAAIPYQGGDNHINEQWQSYWYGLFKENNFVGIDLIRPQIWENINVKSWYKQNCMLYIHESKTLLFKNLEKFNFPLNIVHEEIFNIRPEYFSMVRTSEPDLLDSPFDVYGLAIQDRLLSGTKSKLQLTPAPKPRLVPQFPNRRLPIQRGR